MGIQWIVIITLFIIVLQRWIYTKWGLARIRYTRFFSHRAVFEGEQIEMVDEISNQKILPVPWLRLESNIDANLQFKKSYEVDTNHHQFHRSLFSLMPYQKVARKHHVTCIKRGYYGLRTVAITSGDPLGFAGKHQSETIDVSAAVLVYPSLVPMEDIPLPSHSWQGDIVVRRWIIEDPFIAAGVREYTYGDPMNNVNWKATARSGILQVTKKDYTADHHLMIYLNFDLTEDIWMPITDESLIEKGISYAASIAQYAISQGIPTGFGCNSYLNDPFKKVVTEKEPIHIQPQGSKSHQYYLFETMAKLKMERSKSFHLFLEEEVGEQMKDTDLLFITAFVSEKMQAHIQKLEAKGNAVEILRLDQERSTRETGENTEEGEALAQ